MKDIGPLIGEISADIKKEEYEAVKDALIKAFWPVVMKTATQGFPDWYFQKIGAVEKENV